MLFFVEVPPPHTADHIKDRFEDELDCYGVHCLMVVTDNAANMKCAFEVTSSSDVDLDVDINIDDIDDIDESDEPDEDDLLKQWVPHQLHFDGWIGCAAHQLQLVVNDGYGACTHKCRNYF